MHLIKMPESVPFEHSDISGMILENEFNGKKCIVVNEYNDKRWPDLLAVKILNSDGVASKNAIRVHKSWIEKIEDSEFEKWYSDTHWVKESGMYSWLYKSWQASEKKTHELYHELVNINKYIVDSIVNNTNSRGLQDKLLKDICAELDKIKKSLP